MNEPAIPPTHVGDVATRITALALEASPLLLGLDLDGTLSLLVDRAPEARLLPGAHEVLVALNRLPQLEVFIVSGRSRHDARTTFEIAEDIRLIGSHGRERHDGRETIEDRSGEIDRFEADMGMLIDGVEGAWIERKPHSVALHVRQVEAGRAQNLVTHFRHMAPRDGWDLLEGSAVIEAGIFPLDKGVAIEELRNERGLRSVCFVGDDITDERVFRRLGPFDLGIKVGSGPTQAHMRLETPKDVVAALRLVVEQLSADPLV